MAADRGGRSGERLTRADRGKPPPSGMPPATRGRSGRLDEPREPGRDLLPSYDPEAFGAALRADRPLPGHRAVHRLDDR